MAVHSTCKGAIRRRGAALVLLALVSLGACTFPAPPEPTAIPATATQAATATRPVTPTPAVPATPATATASPPPRVTLTLPPTNTAPPPTATGNPAGVLAALAVTPQGERFTLVLDENQVNAALARAFDAAPLPGHALAPRATLGFNFMSLSMHIYPPEAPPGDPPQWAVLMLGLEHPGGFLETQPSQLEPLDAGIPTRPVKAGERLLLDALNEIIHSVAGERPLFCERIAIRPEGLTLHLIR